jgi:RES domain-containing protein
VELGARGGEYHRVADPSWSEPLDGSYSMQFGGRWNAPGSFPVTYLSADLGTAKANARRLLTHRLSGQPFRAEDLDPTELPVLVSVEVPDDRYLDVVSDAGCARSGLPATYPDDGSGHVVSWSRCQEVGRRAREAALPGVACRSAAPRAPLDGEELALFGRPALVLEPRAVRPFGQWYGRIDW